MTVHGELADGREPVSGLEIVCADFFYDVTLYALSS